MRALTATRLLFILLLVMSHQAGAGIVIESTEQREEQGAKGWTVVSQDGELFYDGKLKEKGVEALITLYDSLETKPTTLAIRSTGGSSTAGMRLGEFVFAHKMNVRVAGYCGSSCANYVFTAAIFKKLDKEAIVWWHGAARSQLWEIPGTTEVYRCKTVDACGKELAVAFKEKYKCQSAEKCAQELAEVEQRLASEFDSLRTREAAFFNTIAVDPRVAVYGQEMIDCKCNWTFSVDDMRKFNIQNVVIDKRTAPNSHTDETKKIAKDVRRKVTTLRLPKTFTSFERDGGA